MIYYFRLTIITYLELISSIHLHIPVKSLYISDKSTFKNSYGMIPIL